jgi:hypothetical protein
MLAPIERAKEVSYEPTEPCHPAKALSAVITSQANHPNVGDIFLFAVLRATGEMNVMTDLVEQYVGEDS